MGTGSPMAPLGTGSAFILVDIFSVTQSFIAALLKTKHEGFDGRTG